MNKSMKGLLLLGLMNVTASAPIVLPILIYGYISSSDRNAELKEFDARSECLDLERAKLDNGEILTWRTQAELDAVIQDCIYDRLTQ